MSYVRAALFIFVIHALFAVAGWMIAGQMGAITGTLIALAFHLFVLARAEQMVLAFHNAREVDLEDKNPMYRAFVKETRTLADESGLTRPRTFIVETHQPNAFVIGRDAVHASIAVTTGLLNTLTREEARNVIAHELAHVKRGDSLAMGVAAAVSAVLTRLVWIFFKPFGLDKAAGRVISRVIAIASASRSREYAADREAVKLTGTPLNLASALEKIERNAISMINPTAERNPSTAHLHVVDPLHTRNRKQFSSHPATDRRIARLREMAEEQRNEVASESSGIDGAYMGS